MRVLILSCNTGGGHNACAEAIQTCFARHADPCDIADSLNFVSEKLSKFMSWGHTTIYRHVPGLFRVGYGLAERYPSVLEDDAAAYKLVTGGTQQLAAYIRDGGYDTVICTHVFSGLLLAQTVREYSLVLKTAFVGTDYTCSPGTANSGLDCYFIPSASLAAEFIDQGVPPEKIVPSGIPVRQEFYENCDKAQAKQKLGLDPSCVHLLVMCGSMGCGPLEKLTKLLRDGMKGNMAISVICGTNEKLRNELSAAYGQEPNVRVHGFVTDMSAMMDSADLYLTKPGGLSSTEAAAKNLPMVFIDAVAGCEAYNLRYFTGLGGAVSAKSVEDLARLTLELLADAPQRGRMASALAAHACENAALVIRDTLRAKGDRA